MSNRNYTQELNELFGSVIEEVEKDLNKWSFGDVPQAEKAPGNIYHTPLIKLLAPVQKVSISLDAFNLDPPMAGGIKDNQFTIENIEDIVIVRRAVGYSYSIRALESKDKTLIKPLLKEMVLALVDAKGYTPEKLNKGIYGTFKRPGTVNEYFREMETAAAFEIRLFSNCQLAEKLEK